MKKILLGLLCLVIFVSCGNVSSSGAGNVGRSSFNIDPSFSVKVNGANDFTFTDNQWDFSFEEYEYDDDDGVEFIKLVGVYTIDGTEKDSTVKFEGTSLRAEFKAFSKEEYNEYCEEIAELKKKIEKVGIIEPEFNSEEKTINLEVTDSAVIKKILLIEESDYYFYKMKYSDLLDELFDAIEDGDIVKTTADKKGLMIIDYDDDEQEKIIFSKK